MKTIILAVLCAVGLSGCARPYVKNIQWTGGNIVVGPIVGESVLEIPENYDIQKAAWIKDHEMGLRSDGVMVWRKMESSTGKQK